MYDLAADPHEMENIYPDPRYGTIRSELEALLAQRPNDALPEPLKQTGMA